MVVQQHLGVAYQSTNALDPRANSGEISPEGIFAIDIRGRGASRRSGYKSDERRKSLSASPESSKPRVAESSKDARSLVYFLTYANQPSLVALLRWPQTDV